MEQKIEAEVHTAMLINKIGLKVIQLKQLENSGDNND